MGKNIIVIIIVLFILILILSNTNDKDNRNKVDTVAKPSVIKSATQLEEEKNLKTSQYCAAREKNHRYYPMFELTRDTQDNIDYKVNNDLRKTGTNLSQEDCRITIDFLYQLAEKSNVNIDYVIEGRYWIGMNIVELFLSLGFPDKENISNYGSGETSQYIYYKDNRKINALYIYAEDGKITSYQDY